MSAVEARSQQGPREVAGGNGQSSLITDQPGLSAPIESTTPIARLFLAGAGTPKQVTDTIEANLRREGYDAFVLPSVLSPFDHYDPGRYQRMARFAVGAVRNGREFHMDEHSLGLLEAVLVDAAIEAEDPDFFKNADLSNAHRHLWTTAGPHHKLGDTIVFGRSLLSLGDTLLGISPAARGPVSFDLAAPIGVDVAKLEKIIDVAWSDKVHSDEAWTDLKFVGDRSPYTEWANERSVEALSAADADLASLLNRVVIDNRGRRGIKTARSRKLYLHDAVDYQEIRALLDEAMIKRGGAVGRSLVQDRIRHNAELGGIEVNVSLPSGISGWTQAILGLPGYTFRRTKQAPEQIANAERLIREMFKRKGAVDSLARWEARGATIDQIVPGLDELSRPSIHSPYPKHRILGTHLGAAVSMGALIEAPRQIAKARSGSLRVVADSGTVYDSSTPPIEHSRKSSRGDALTLVKSA